MADNGRRHPDPIIEFDGLREFVSNGQRVYHIGWSVAAKGKVRRYKSSIDLSEADYRDIQSSDGQGHILLVKSALAEYWAWIDRTGGEARLDQPVKDRSDFLTLLAYNQSPVQDGDTLTSRTVDLFRDKLRMN